MINTITLQDFVVFKRAVLDMSSGLTAVTGETGAGKSVFLHAVKVALGESTHRRLVRSGCAHARVTVSLSPGSTHSVWQQLTAAGLALRCQATLTLERVISRSGRSKSFLNGVPVRLSLVKRLGALLVEIHGQGSGVCFLAEENHMALLDEFGNTRKPFAEKAAKVAKYAAQLKAFESELKKQQQRQAMVENNSDFLKMAEADLKAFAPQSGELEQLTQERAQLKKLQLMEDDLQNALRSFDLHNGDDTIGAGLRCLDQALGRTQVSQGYTENRCKEKIENTSPSSIPSSTARGLLSDLVARSEAALCDLNDIASGLRTVLLDVDLDRERLYEIDNRLTAYRELGRKYKIPPDKLKEFFDDICTQLSLLHDTGMSLESLERDVEKANEAYKVAAGALSVAREKVAAVFERRIKAEFAPLRLDKMGFCVKLCSDPTRVSPIGFENARFMVAPNGAKSLSDIKSVVSGGEASRLVLALKVVLFETQPGACLIFDEIDVGVGGGGAQAIGGRLRALSAQGQIISITHSPQITALAAHHIQIRKTKAKGGIAKAVILDKEGRTEEVARMLSGAHVTPASRAAAAALLEDKVKDNPSNQCEKKVLQRKSVSKNAMTEARKSACNTDPKTQYKAA